MNNPFLRSLYRHGLQLTAFALLAVGGCGGRSDADLPKTFPVQGKVVSKDGKSLAGGMVQFQAVGGQPLSTIGPIQQDGSFSLTTSQGNQRLPGAIEGTYQVIIIPPIPEDQSVEPITLPKTYKVEPKENHFTFEVDKPRRRP